MKFLTLNVDFCSPSPDIVCSRRSAHVGVKKGYLIKSCYFTTIGLSIVKTVADRHRHVAYHNKH